MRQTKQQLQQEIERLQARLVAFGITEEMEPATTMVIKNAQTLGVNLASLTAAPVYFPPAVCEVCYKPATAFVHLGTSAGRSYCQEHNPLGFTVNYTNQVTTDGKPLG